MKILRLLAALSLLCGSVLGQSIDRRAMGTNSFFMNVVNAQTPNGGGIDSKHWTNDFIGIAPVMRPVDTHRPLWHDQVGQSYTAMTIQNLVTNTDTFSVAIEAQNNSSNSASKAIYYQDGVFGATFEASNPFGALRTGESVGVLGLSDGPFNTQYGVDGLSVAQFNSQTNVGVFGSALANGKASTLRVGGYFESGTNTQSNLGVPSYTESSAVVANSRSGGDFIFIGQTNNTSTFKIGADGDLDMIKSVTYSWPSTNATAGQAIASDGGSPQQLYWTNFGTGSGSSIGPGTPNFLAKFITSSNVTDSRIVQDVTNRLNYNVLTNWGAITNSWTNYFFTERTDTNNYQRLTLIAQTPGSSLYNELTSERGSGDARAQNKLLFQKSWLINGVGAGSGNDAAGSWLPLVDASEDIGSGGNRVRDSFNSRYSIITPLSSAAQWTAAAGGAGMGHTTDGTMVQFFRDTGITAAFNKERNVGTLQFDLAGNLLGFGAGISNTAAYFQDSGVAGLIGVGTNNSTTAPLRVGFMPRSANGTDKGGAQMVLLGGAGTGTGRGGDIAFGTARPSTTSATVNSYTTNFFIAANSVTLTESTATTVFSVAIATNKSIGMMITATTVANDGSVYQTVMEQFAVSAAVDAAYTPVVSASAPIATYQRSGTLTTTWTAVQNAGSIDVKCNAVSSLTQTTLKILGYQVVINTDGTSVITPQ